MSTVSTSKTTRKTDAKNLAHHLYLCDVEKDLGELARLLAGMAASVSKVQDEFLTDDLLAAIGRVRALELRLDGYVKGAYAPPAAPRLADRGQRT